MTQAPGDSSSASDGPGTGIGGASGSTATTEWPKRAVAVVDLVVDIVHDRAVRPIMLAARIIVFGILVAVLAFVVLVLLSIGLLRLLDVYAFEGRVWISYAVLGGLFTLLGLLRGPGVLPGTHRRTV